MPRIAAALATLSLIVHGAALEGQQCTAVSKPSLQKVKPSPTNPQYVLWNGRTQPLIGMSGSYLCHVEQPDSFGNPPLTPSVNYCEFTNYRSYIDNLTISFATGNTIPGNGLNTLRLWIGLNHSPGIERGYQGGQPYPHETPFNKPYNTNGSVNGTFFARLKCVLDYAWANYIVVEVTIFDPWEGNFSSSPWTAYFQNKNCFASKDFVLPSGFTCNTDPATKVNNQAGWTKQKQLITELVTRYCSYPNIYYEIANEVDLTSGGLAPHLIQSWHQEMTAHLTATEASPGLGCGHFVAANFMTTGNVDTLPASFAAISAHYTATSDARLGANELLRTRHNGGSGGPELNRIFGFNETRITSIPELTADVHFQSADAARAESWEFLMSEGGIYDLYGEHWQTAGSHTHGALKSLKLANGLLAQVNLDRVQRSQSVGNALPTWISPSSSLPPYGGANNTRWGAMHSPMTQVGDTNLLYIHHSTLGDGPFQRYTPVTGSYAIETILVVLPAGNYSAQWIDPKTGIIKATLLFTVAVSNAPTSVPKPTTNPTYTFDIALRIKRV
jgi:hypothetical protein